MFDVSPEVCSLLKASCETQPVRRSQQSRSIKYCLPVIALALSAAGWMMLTIVVPWKTKTKVQFRPPKEMEYVFDWDSVNDNSSNDGFVFDNFEVYARNSEGWSHTRCMCDSWDDTQTD